MEWYYIDNLNNIIGPVSLQLLDHLENTHVINNETLMFTDGMKEWKPLTYVKEIIVINPNILFNSEESNAINKSETNIKDENYDEGEFNLVGRKRDIIESDNYKQPEDTNTKNILNVDILKDNNLNKDLKLVENEVSDDCDLDKLKKDMKTINKFQKYKEKAKTKWYNPKINTNAYVSNLPLDVNNKMLINFFSKCGFIRKDPKSKKLKIKIYKNDKGENKGDALISFEKEESVDIAVTILNGSEILPGYHVKVEKAVFEQKGDYKPRTNEQKQSNLNEHI